MKEGQAFQLKEPYIHPTNRLYTFGWLREVKEAEGRVSLLLAPGIADEKLRRQFSQSYGVVVSPVDVVVDFPIDQLGDRMSAAFDGGDA